MSMQSYNDLRNMRIIRRLISSVACFVLAFFAMRLTLRGTNNDWLLLQILMLIMYAGTFYTAFAVGHYATRILSRILFGISGVIPSRPILNIVIDCIIYLGVSVGALFLFFFVADKLWYVGLIIMLIGISHVIADVKYVISLF